MAKPIVLALEEGPAFLDQLDVHFDPQVQAWNLTRTVASKLGIDLPEAPRVALGRTLIPGHEETRYNAETVGLVIDVSTAAYGGWKAAPQLAKLPSVLQMLGSQGPRIAGAGAAAIELTDSAAKAWTLAGDAGLSAGPGVAGLTNWMTSSSAGGPGGSPASVGIGGGSLSTPSIPQVKDPKLQNIVNDLYKGAKGPTPIGTGSTADAVRSELETGMATQGKFHTQKAQEYFRALNNWLTDTTTASHHDKLVAETLMKDLFTALNGK